MTWCRDGAVQFCGVFESVLCQEAASSPSSPMLSHLTVFHCDISTHIHLFHSPRSSFRHRRTPFSSQSQSTKKKDGPKKPLKGYMLFAQEHRDQVKKENPDISFGGIGKELGAMWRALDEKTKENYKAGKKGGK